VTGTRPNAAPALALEFIGSPGASLDGIAAAAHAAEEGGWVDRIWNKDTSVWSSDSSVRRTIADRLGWLDAPDKFDEELPELEAFAAEARATFSGAVLAGMGGSSLAPAVLASTFGPRADGIPVHVLDSTDPAAVAAIEAASPPGQTLYLISSKSGTTTETLAFEAYFLGRVDAALDAQERLVDRVVDAAHRGPERWVTDHFVAITDPGASVDAIPWSDRFREVFLNAADIGGRYSALTYVGLVPGALLGLDLDALLGAASGMAQRCRAGTAAANPGLALGLAMGTLARAGRDKLTLVIDPRIATFGAWIEQLVAESTGKDGRGIVPVDGEPLGEPSAYGEDRFFVSLELDGETENDADRRRAALEALASAGHPVARIALPDLTAVGAEFFRWEFATAIAGAVLGVNPFDEPNVTESKRNTERVLDEHPPRREGIAADDDGLADALAESLAHIGPRDYLAVTAFLAPTPERDAALERIRVALRDATRRATTVGYGPRYLHSTGQLHKGGAPIGWFLQLVASRDADLEIPGSGYGFGALIDAQADGDLASLEAHGLPIRRIDLGADPDAGLARLEAAVGNALRAVAR
jgi:glucose-6-phosphate isomerase